MECDSCRSPPKPGRKKRTFEVQTGTNDNEYNLCDMIFLKWKQSILQANLIWPSVSFLLVVFFLNGNKQIYKKKTYEINDTERNKLHRIWN